MSAVSGKMEIPAVVYHGRLVSWLAWDIHTEPIWVSNHLDWWSLLKYCQDVTCLQVHTTYLMPQQLWQHTASNFQLSHSSIFWWSSGNIGVVQSLPSSSGYKQQHRLKSLDRSSYDIMCQNGDTYCELKNSGDTGIGLGKLHKDWE